jgi:radical SAM superfamily enzyme YgiQ (UPF0313 family)
MTADATPVRRRARILLVALYSERYPAIGETHGISVLGGCLETALGSELETISILDMVASGAGANERLLDIIAQSRPTIIGISLPYGTYDTLQAIYPKIKRALAGTDHLMVFGGALATYIPEQLISNVDQSAVIVLGEGEEATVSLVRRWLDHMSLEDIPNTCYFQGNTIRRQQRSLVDLRTIPAPYRKHMADLVSSGAQVFAESSRACSWSACTFCLRGLTDVQGKGFEYRRFPIGRLGSDLKALTASGVKAFTFADEDFLGGAETEREQFVSDLGSLIHTENIRLEYDVSMTINSVYSSRATDAQNHKRQDLLQKLKQAGLRKVFLGMESGSSSQLKRYAKGHTPTECAVAARTVNAESIALEIGFIMFDPLCSLSEIEENLRFLLENGLVGYVSSLFNEMRLQIGTRYLTALEKAELKLGRKLFDRDIDLNTLSHSYNYADPGVGTFVAMARRWNSHITRLHYPLKNLSRYGQGGMLGELLVPVRALLREMRLASAGNLLRAVQVAMISSQQMDDIEKQFYSELSAFSERITDLFRHAPHSLLDHPIVSSLLSAASEEHIRRDMRSG